MSIYFDMYCCLQAIRWSFANVGCIYSVLSGKTNMCPTSGWLNIFKSIAEVRFHYPLLLSLVTELQTLKRRKVNSICHILRTNSPLTLILLMWRIWWAPNNASRWQMVFNSAFKGLKHLTEGKMEGLRRRGRRRKHLLNYFKEKRTYCNLKEEAPDRTNWRTWLGTGNGPVPRRTTQCMNRLYHVRIQTLVHGSGPSAGRRSGDCFLDGTTSFVKNSFCARALLSHHTPLPNTA